MTNDDDRAVIEFVIVVCNVCDHTIQRGADGRAGGTKHVNTHMDGSHFAGITHEGIRRIQLAGLRPATESKASAGFCHFAIN